MVVPSKRNGSGMKLLRNNGVGTGLIKKKLGEGLTYVVRELVPGRQAEAGFDSYFPPKFTVIA
jgi:hypothetical protein